MQRLLFLTAPGPPCPKCGKELAAHPERWTLDDYVRGFTGQGPKITAADVGRPKCVPAPDPEPDGPFCRGCDKPFAPPYRGAETCTDCLYRRADALWDRQRDAGL